jgi:quinoprotein dehydrogenase-associated probable ABC transporter substrate-binding protein
MDLDPYGLPTPSVVLLLCAGVLALGLAQPAAGQAAAGLPTAGPPPAAQPSAEVGPTRELRVCADPDNLPFSNDRGEGFENQVAQLVADDLHARLSYTWHPQRRGFISATLKAGRCDLVIGVPVGYDLVLATRPYYTSSYVFVTARQRGLGLHSFDDPQLRSLRIGLHVFGDDGANAPPAHALARRGIRTNVVGYTMLGSDDSPSGKIVDAVAAGEIDVAIVWGPFAGPFARKQRVALDVAQIMPVLERLPLPLVFDIAMGVRRGDQAFKAELDELLERRRDDIQALLDAAGVPLVAPATLARAPDIGH